MFFFYSSCKFLNICIFFVIFFCSIINGKVEKRDKTNL